MRDWSTVRKRFLRTHEVGPALLGMSPTAA